MENKLSIESALTNSNKFVKKVADILYNEKEVVSGADLPKMTPIREVNFIFIYILLQSWKSETQNLKSPYFNFEKEEVKKVLDKLMNILSNNIEIKRQDFEPLLKKSFQLSLLLFKNAITFLDQIFNEKVTLKELEEMNKFLKLSFVDSITEFLNENNENEISISEIEPTSLELPNSADFLVKLDGFLDLQTQPFKPKVENEFKQPTLNDQFEKEENTLNDQHSQKDVKTILESHSGSRVESVLNSIPLNEQFKITNDVFGGMKSVYDSFIEKLEKAESFAEATVLVDEYVSKSEHLENNKYLNEIIERKFIS